MCIPAPNLSDSKSEECWLSPWQKWWGNFCGGPPQAGQTQHPPPSLCSELVLRGWEWGGAASRTSTGPCEHCLEPAGPETLPEAGHPSSLLPFSKARVRCHRAGEGRAGIGSRRQAGRGPRACLSLTHKSSQCRASLFIHLETAEVCCPGSSVAPLRCH